MFTFRSAAVSVIALVLFVGTAAPAHAALTESQISSIIALLQSFGADSTTVANVNLNLHGQSSGNASSNTSVPNDNEGSGAGSAASCPSLNRTLSRGSTDITTGGEVSMLQGFLTDYFNLAEPVASGYYGVVTEKYVRQFQANNGIEQVGYVGTKTRAAIARSCSSTSVPPPSTISCPVYNTCPSGYSTNTSTDSNGCTKISCTATATIPSTPSITFSSVSLGTVTGSYANLPANSQVRLVSAATGQPYLAQSTMVWSGGSGSLSISIPSDLVSGTYYLRVTDYYNPNTTIAQSGGFTVTSSASVPQATATIDVNSLTSTSNHPVITGSAQNATMIGLSISQNGGKFDGTGNFSVTNGVWSVTLNNQTYTPGTYGIQVYDSTNTLLTTGTLTVSAVSTTPQALIKLGDVTQNGALSSLDSSRVLQYLQGLTTFTAGQKLLADANLDGMITEADATLILNMVVGNSAQVLMGDVTRNGAVSSLDASYVQQYLAGTKTFTPDQKLLADVNLDGSITQDDANLMLSMAVGL